MSCPMCAKDTVQKYRPFCSQRCADLDLGKWLTGSYAIPSSAVDEDDDILVENTSDRPRDPSDLN
jgi:uncharacterized protein